MKKVLALAALAALVSTSAFAGIANTKHDLSTGSSDAGANGTSTEICVYCHTPHGGLAGFAPLWNRTNPASVNAVYNSSTLNASPTVAAADASDAILCLSCHDGVSLTLNLINAPNVGGGGNPTSNITASNFANLGDLSNDHPVAFVYSTAAAPNDPEINPTPAAPIKVTYGTTNNQMWCSSCHDVHNNGNAPFLVMNNAGSNLCLACHNK